MENINSILIGVVGTALTAIISFLTQKITKWFNSKAKSEDEKRLLNGAINIVSSVVKQVYQTYIEEIKGTNAWNKDTQKEALSAAVAMAKQLMSTEVENYITKAYGDIFAWLHNEIEAKIYDLKSDRK